MELDPAWEYREVDPEFAFLELRASARETHGEAVEMWITARQTSTLCGFQFGRGDPNKRVARVGRARPEHRRNTATPKRYRCSRDGCAQLVRETGVLYCSRSCASRATQPPQYVLVCNHCGADFRRYNGARLYCSKSCWVAGARAARTKPCKRCGAAFHDPRGRAEYCSMRCRSLASWDGRRRAEHPCGVCGGLFVRRRPGVRFCSPACRARGAATSRRANAVGQ